MRTKNVIVSLVSLAMIGAGVALIASFFFSQGSGGGAASGEGGEFNVPVLEESTDREEGEEQPEEPRGPEDKTLVVTIPEMGV